MTTHLPIVPGGSGLPPIRAVIFDMDGLMLDTEPLYRAAWQEAARACGLHLSDEIYARLVGKTVEDAEGVLANTFGGDFSPDAFRLSRRKFEALTFSAAPPQKKPGLDELLQLLTARRIPKAVATSTKRQRAVSQLDATGLLQQFDAVAAGDEVASGKPSPDLFLLAAQRLGVAAAACLALEDAEAGILSATRAGMRAYLVPDLHSPSPETVALATATFVSLTAVARHLESEFPDCGPRE